MTDAFTTTKKVKLPPPDVPPMVATAALVVRAAVHGVLGLAAIADGQVLQRTYLQDSTQSAKLTVTYERNETVDDAMLQTAIRDACRDLIAAAVTIQRADGAQHQHVALGETCAHIAVVQNYLIASIPAGRPFSRSSALQSIELVEFKRGKKGRKGIQYVTIKFVAIGSCDEGGALAETITEIDNWSLYEREKIRCSQGELIRVEAQKKKQEEALVASADDHDAIASKTTPATTANDEMVVNVETVSGKIDYDKLVQQFGSQRIHADLLERLRAARKIPLHRFLRRGIFFSHRDLDLLLKQVELGKPLYLYTGRGPSSSSMHLGHLIPFLFTKWLQDAFDCPLVIQMTDDEKFLFKGSYNENDGDNLEYFQGLTIQNARDIIACEKTFIFSDVDYIGSMYPNIVRIWKAVTTNTVNGIFGFDGSSNLGKIAFPAIQAAPSFPSSFPKVLEADRTSDLMCLIPCAIDQDPYFRMTRDIARKLCHKEHALGGKPALIHSKFFPPLQGASGKMSSSDENSAIFLTDTAADIERKIKEHAFSGGQDTKKKQQELGADLDADVSYQWLRFFLEDDDELERIGREYSTGSGDYWSTGSVKARLVEVLQELVAAHQQRRAQISDDDVRNWMKERSILGK
jgi:tryptophanyl-tRNA synthetase